MTALIPALSLLPACFFRSVDPALPPIPGIDKLIHALMYAGLTAAYAHTLPLAKRARIGSVLMIALIASAYGVAMELCQKWLTTSRAMDPLDALANSAGAFACALLSYAWARRRECRTKARP
jgi:VanZ family protein